MKPHATYDTGMRVLVDFNAETSDGLLIARQERLDSPVVCGKPVQAYDDDGHHIMASIERIDHEHGVVYMRPDWSTWTTASYGLGTTE